jgi:hypothetical protein
MHHFKAFSAFKRCLALAAMAALPAAMPMLASPAPASAADATLVTIAAPDQGAASGEQLTIAILVDPATDIAGMQLDLHFDPTLFTVDSVSQGDLFTQGGASAFFNTGTIDNQAGLITGAFSSILSPGAAVSGHGTFATITFTAIADSNACPLALSGIIVGDRDGNPVPASVTNNQPFTSDPDAPTFRWWVLSLIVGIALAIVAATSAGLLYRRHMLLKQNAGR